MMLLVDSFYIMIATSIVAKTERKENTVTDLSAYIGMYHLLDCDYLQHYEVELTGLDFIFYKVRRNPVDILDHFNKIVKQYNKFKVA